MFPTLLRFRLDDLEVSVSTYGVFLTLGVLVALLAARRGAARAGVSTDRVVLLGLWMVVGGLLVARGGWWLLRLDGLWEACTAAAADERIAVCTRPARIWEGGLVWYGGIVGGLVAAALYARRARLPLLSTLDLVAAPAALGHAIGRLGCLAAGCCWGKPAVPPAPGLELVRGSAAYEELSLRGAIPLEARSTPPLHPTQMYEALAELAIFGILVFLGRRGRRARRPGVALAAYLGLYGLARAVVEILRGDPGRRFLVRATTPDLAGWLGIPPDAATFLTVDQAASVILILAAVGLTLYVRRRSPA